MRNILIFFVVLCNVFMGVSQTFKGLSIKDGLSDLVVNALYKDSLGFLWIGTSKSVERYDGVRFKHYDIPADNPKAKEVNAIIGMPGNEILFGNNSGLWKVEGDTILKMFPKKINRKINYLLYDESSDKIYCGGESGLYICSGDSVSHKLINYNIYSAENNINGLIVHDGNLWMSTSEGLYSMNINTGTIDGYRYSGGTNAFTEICCVNDILYLGTSDRGIVSFDLKEKVFSHLINIGQVTSLSTNGENVVYAATNGSGIYFISVPDGKVLRRIQHDTVSGTGIRSNSVYSLLVDRDGIVWTGIFQMGIDYSLFQHEMFRLFQPKCDINFKYLAVRTLEVGESDRFIGARDGLYYIDIERNIYKSYKSPEMRSDMVLCSCNYNGKYYIGTYGGGIYVFDPSDATLHDLKISSSDEVFTKGQIFSIAEDYAGNLWIGTSQGLYCYNNGKILYHYTGRNSQLPNDNVYYIFFDSTNRGWVCTDLGLALISDKADRAVFRNFPKGFIGDRLVRVVYEDSSERLYFLQDNGSLITSNLSLTDFSEITSTPLDGKNLLFITEGNTGELWIGTNSGLFCYDKKGNFRSIDSTDGLTTSIFLSCMPKKSKDGRLWFGSSQGVFFTNTDNVDSSSKKGYRIQLSSALSAGISLNFFSSDGEFSVSLPKNSDELTLSLADLTYSGIEHAVYEYKYDSDEIWKTLKGKSDIVLYDIPSGRSELQIRLYGNSDTQVSVDIYKPYSFAIIWNVVFVILFVAVLYYLLVLRRNRKRIVDAEVSNAVLEPISEKLTEEEQYDEHSDKYKFCNLTDEDCKKLLEQLTSVMTEEKLFVNPKLKISDLAEKMGVHSYKLSYLFNQHMQCSFYDYINDYRVLEFKKLIEKGEHKSYSINALMEKCGFTSRSTFFRYFKKNTGMTPNEYISSSGI
ncbi:two-component regulator propeller domain-containing protein [Bacteroides sp.]|uniref:two-component regulator propeller domain-containing protein n=1 Tax=Bacteroides sp. TaxID=29523 RepID=UPI0025C10688|nr:two-component regulator propeller domain-containing protein [Bacteroides sp.]